MREEDQVEQALLNLVDRIKESDEYIRYRVIQDKIHAMPKLEQEINAFRSENYRVQNSNGTLDIYEETDRMEREYREWRTNPLVSEYLAAESAFCRMFQHINWTLIEAMDFEAGLVD